MELLSGAVMAGAAAALVAVARRSARGQVRACVEAAHQVGLQGVRTKARGLWGRTVLARQGPHAVRIRTFYHHDARRTLTQVEIDGLTTRFSMRNVFLPPFSSWVLQGPAVHLGDDVFDATIAVRGSERTAAAVLDHRTRGRVRELFATRASASTDGRGVGGGRLEGGRLVVEQAIGDQPLWIASYLRDLLALAEALREPSDVEKRLIANLREDPDPQVRLTSLRLLTNDGPPGPSLQEALRGAVQDPHETVALDAAIALGAEGRPAVMRIATEGWASDGGAARAVHELRVSLTVEQLRSLLSAALRRRHRETARACVEALGYRGPAQAEIVARVLAIEDGELAAVAARALGRVGGVDHVESLHEAGRRLPRDTELKRAVRDAVAAIRSRLTGAGEGQVSLADTDSGRVSLSTDGSGRVSLPDDDEGP